MKKVSRVTAGSQRVLGLLAMFDLGPEIAEVVEKIIPSQLTQHFLG